MKKASLLLIMLLSWASSLPAKKISLNDQSSERCLIRVSDISTPNSTPGLSDTSDNFFSIIPPLYSTDLGKWTYYPFEKEQGVYALAVDHSDILWIGLAFGDILCFDKNTWRKIPKEQNGLTNSVITYIFVDDINRKWFGSYLQKLDDTILVCFDGTSWQPISFLDKNTSAPALTRINEISQDKDGLIWLAGNNAVVQLNPDFNWIVYNKSNSGLGFDKITSVTVDKNNVKWFGRGDVGRSLGDIVSFDGNVWKIWKEPNGFLTDDPINHVTVDQDSLIGFFQGKSYSPGVMYFFDDYKEKKAIMTNYTYDLICDKNSVLGGSSLYPIGYDRYGIAMVSLRVDRYDGKTLVVHFINSVT